MGFKRDLVTYLQNPQSSPDQQRERRICLALPHTVGLLSFPLLSFTFLSSPLLYLPLLSFTFLSPPPPPRPHIHIPPSAEIGALDEKTVSNPAPIQRIISGRIWIPRPRNHGGKKQKGKDKKMLGRRDAKPNMYPSDTPSRGLKRAERSLAVQNAHWEKSPGQLFL